MNPTPGVPPGIGTEKTPMKSLHGLASISRYFQLLLATILFCGSPTLAQSTTQIASPPPPENPVLQRPWEVGKVLSPPALPGILRGQFEYAGEFFPLWQSYTPAPHLQAAHTVSDGVPET